MIHALFMERSTKLESLMEVIEKDVKQYFQVLASHQMATEGWTPL